MERMAADNDAFDSDIRLEGVLPDGRILISQPLFPGVHPTEEEIEAFLEGVGFIRQADGSLPVETVDGETV
jgi:hypothetical protein